MIDDPAKLTPATPSTPPQRNHVFRVKFALTECDGAIWRGSKQITIAAIDGFPPPDSAQIRRVFWQEGPDETWGELGEVVAIKIADIIREEEEMIEWEIMGAPALPSVDEWNACEWNMTKNEPTAVSDLHAVATVLLGSKTTWRLCEDCAKLPEFRRYRRRIRIVYGTQQTKSDTAEKDDKK